MKKLILKKIPSKQKSPEKRKTVTLEIIKINIVSSSNNIFFKNAFLTGVVIKLNHPHQKTHSLAKHMRVIDRGGN
jgi:hypothetical protein